jgi:3-oxoacyl-[acyl-carrier protein] reductase
VEGYVKRLEGKVAIITGAGKGIGRATAIEFAKEGAKVIMAGVRESSMAEVKGEVAALTGDYLVVQTDISKFADATNLAAQTMERFGRIDVLVNNAGIHPLGKQGERLATLDIDDDGWDIVLNTNLKGQFNCIKAVMATMMAQRSGTIVNLSSSTALTGNVGSAPYCASKAGIMALTKVVAKELGPYNVSVNCVAPGLTMTPMNSLMSQETIEMAKTRIPLGRPGEAVDIARAILCVASENLFMTGQTIVVDGGSVMH